MKLNYIKDTDELIAGITLRDRALFEDGSLALHTTKNKDKIIENRKDLTAALGITMNNFVAASQTHSANVYKVTVSDRGRGAQTISDAISNTDALYTTETDILLCTLTADCVPVIFCSKNHPLIGVIHSGWKGTVKEITFKVFNHLKHKENNRPEDLCVHLGPALSEEKFEVDADVYEKYKKLGYANEYIRYNQKTGKYHIDNQEVVRKQCLRSGIPESQITSDRTCTFLSKKHFSYREDPHTGRHLSFIMMKSS